MPKALNPSEKEIEKAILQYLATIPGMKAWKNQTTGMFDPVKKVYRPLRGQHSGLGSSDILGCYRGRFIAIEVKRPKGSVVSDAQLNFIKQINQCGGLAFVAKSIDDVKKTLQQHLET